MIVKIRAKVVSVSAGDAYMAYRPVLGQAVQISVYSPGADPCIYRMDVLIDLLRRRMITS